MKRLSLAALATAALVLTACGGATPSTPTTEAVTTSSAPSPTGQTTTQEVGTPSPSPTTSEAKPAPATSSAEPSPSKSYDYKPIDMSKPPAKMTAPDAALKLGEVAWVQVKNADVKGGKETVGISVLDILPGKPAFWKNYSNAEDFAGAVPYFIVYQQRFDPALYPDKDPSLKEMWPRYTDGKDAKFLAVWSVVRESDCGISLPKYDKKTGVAMSCFVGIGEGGKKIGQVMYNGMTQFSVIANKDDIYAFKPIVWK